MVAKELTYYTISQLEYFRIFSIGVFLGWAACVLYHNHLKFTRPRLSSLKKFITRGKKI